MAGRPIQVICVGKLKHHFIKEGCTLYQERLEKWRTITVRCVRDGNASLPQAQRIAFETDGLVQALGSDAICYLLDERGESVSSEGLAKSLAKHDHNGFGTITFLIGGPYGVAKERIPNLRGILSLSTLTLPHELARLILLEQLYRAETILRHYPYHHD